jgi:hypothetical protein
MEIFIWIHGQCELMAIIEEKCDFNLDSYYELEIDGNEKRWLVLTFTRTGSKSWISARIRISTV